MPPMPAAPAADVTDVPAVPAANEAPKTASATNAPELADDGDLIEKEWVLKVKQIVRATSNDPYEQNVQLTALKAEYMQKRYGKQIKAEY